MRKNIYSLLFAAISVGAFGQKVNIQWEGSKTFDNGITVKTMPFFTNAGYNIDENGIIMTVTKKMKVKS